MLTCCTFHENPLFNFWNNGQTETKKNIGTLIENVEPLKVSEFAYQTECIYIQNQNDDLRET